MLKKFLIGVLLTFLFYSSANATGLIFTQTTHPISATCLPLCNLNCLKEGKASSINILYLFEWGDAGIDTAAKSGCIKQVFVVNKSETTFLVLFRKLTTIVYGY